MAPRLEIFTSGADKSLHVGSMVKIRIGAETVVMTAGEWSRAIANPKRCEPGALGDATAPVFADV